MSKEDIGLSRRKVLAGIGAAGVASVGAGMGTSAYFSDTESFDGNTIAAGELDLKVDWEEHYNYPQVYGFDDPTDGLDVTMSEPEDASSYVALPDPENPMVWVHEDDLAAYMANTAIEAFPDTDDDPGQEIDGYVPCEDGADTDVHMDPTRDATAVRTNNADTYDDSADEGEKVKPLLNLTDVKPGDFGEFTLSFHLCDNPGYVWLQAGSVSESENGQTEPEMEVDNDDAPDLAENIQTVWWYDDGDNVLRDVDETLYMSNHGGDNPNALLYEVTFDGDGDADTTELVEISEFAASHIAASPDGETVYIVSETDDNTLARYDVSAGTYDIVTIDGPDDYGSVTDVVQAAVDTDGTLYAGSMSENALYEISDPGGSPTITNRLDLDLDISGADSAFTSNGEFYLFTNSTTALYTVNLLTGDTSQVAELQTDEELTGLSVQNSGTGDFIGSVLEGNELVAFDDSGAEQGRFTLDGDLTEHTYGDLTTGDLAEVVFYQGSLEESLNDVLAGDGFQLNDGNCYQPGMTRYIGFAWWLPTEVGNEVQSDSVEFDLGFYTEQCRHNDGSGPSEEETTTAPR